MAGHEQFGIPVAVKGFKAQQRNAQGFVRGLQAVQVAGHFAAAQLPLLQPLFYGSVEFAPAQMQQALSPVLLCLCLAQSGITQRTPLQRHRKIDPDAGVAPRAAAKVAAQRLGHRHTGFHAFAAHMPGGLGGAVHLHARQ